MNSDLNGLSEFIKILSLGKVFMMVICLVALWSLSHFLYRTSASLGERFPARRLVILQLITVLSFVLYLGGGTFLIYGILQPPKELLLAIGGSLAVAIGLSLKDLMSSLIAGLILLFDRPFQVGDRVTFGDSYGEIHSIGLRAVRLMTLDDNLVTIPNSRFITDVVASGNSGAMTMMVCTEFYLALDADLEKAARLVNELLCTNRYVYLRKPHHVVMREVALADRIAIELRAKAYVLDVKFEKEFQTDLVKRVEEAFRVAKIGRPLRH